MTYSLFEESFFSTSISLRIELNCPDSVASVFKGANSFKAFLKQKKTFLHKYSENNVTLTQTCAESHFFKEKSSQVTQKSSHDFDFFGN